MIQISPDALDEGCERARDLFLLTRLRASDDAAAGFGAVYQALGVSSEMRERLEKALAELVPVRGVPALEATAVGGMRMGVLVGLLIADSALPLDELDLPITLGPDRR
jgi:hypothetical protein